MIVMTAKERAKRTERAEVWTRMNRLVLLADYEDRDMTPEETAEYGELQKRLKKLSAWVKKNGTYKSPE